MTRMLQSMKHRGPDSTGYALYGTARTATSSCATSSRTRTRRATSTSRSGCDGIASRSRRARALGARIIEVEEETPYAFRVSFDYDGDLKLLADFVEDIPEAEVSPATRSRSSRTSATRRASTRPVRPRRLQGTHAIGHVRMATESEVDIAGAHPYWAYPYSDVAVVHNGQLTNYFMWRRRSSAPPLHVRVRLRDHRRLPRRGDVEGLARGAMHKSLDELDGVFTYIAVTKDELGVAKDELAAKPLVLYGRTTSSRCVRGDRDPPDRRPRDRHYDPYEREVLVWQR